MSKEYKCERCGAAPERTGYDERSDNEAAAAVAIVEVQTSFGIVWSMCIDCRREWGKWMNNNQLMIDYSENAFRLEHWRVAHRKTGKEDVEKGLALIKKLNKLDTDLHNSATEWFNETKNKPKAKARGNQAPWEGDN